MCCVTCVSNYAETLPNVYKHVEERTFTRNFHHRRRLCFYFSFSLIGHYAVFIDSILRFLTLSIADALILDECEVPDSVSYRQLPDSYRFFSF